MWYPDHDPRVYWKKVTIITWTLIAVLVLFLLLLCGCMRINLDEYSHVPGIPHSGVVNEPPPSSINPEVETYKRCFKRFETEEEFVTYIEWAYRGKKIVYIEALHDGILWKRGEKIEAWIYPKEKD